MAAKLTDKQRTFVAEYLVDLNATRAAIRAGYSARNADKIGPELLGKTRVAAVIAEEQTKRAERTELTQDRVLEELKRIAFGDLRDAVVWGPSGIELVDSAALTDAQAAAIDIFNNIREDQLLLRLSLLIPGTGECLVMLRDIRIRRNELPV